MRGKESRYLPPLLGKMDDLTMGYGISQSLALPSGQWQPRAGVSIITTPGGDPAGKVFTEEETKEMVGTKWLHVDWGSHYDSQMSGCH